MKMIIGKYEATIYPEGDGYTGAISLGFDAAGKRQRVKRKGRTKAQVKDKLREVVEDLAAGVTAAEGYTVADAISDFLDQGMKGKSRGDDQQLPLARRPPPDPAARCGQAQEADRRRTGHVDGRPGGGAVHPDAPAGPPDPGTRHPARPGPGQGPPQRGQPDHRARRPGGPPVQGHDPGPGGPAAGPGRARQPAPARRLRGRVPAGRGPHRRGQSARDGPRSTWTQGTVAVYRSVRAKGDTKTRKSRRLLKLPRRAVEALREHRKRQAAERLQAGDEMAGPRPGLLPRGRHPAGPLAGPPRVRRHHQGRRPGGGVGTTGATALVRVHPQSPTASASRTSAT